MKFIQSGTLPFRKGENGLEILLITSLKQRHWIIPKGIVEPGLSAAESAEREAFEEAGLSGLIEKGSIGFYQIRKWGGVCRIEVFPLLVTSLHAVWPESTLRERRWFDIRNALTHVYPSGLAQIISRWTENRIAFSVF